MIKNYFIVAFRNFWRNKVFSLINIFGLAIGISAALVIYLIVQYEYSYEKSVKDGDRIYRVVSKLEFPDLTIHNSGVPVPTADAARAEITGLEAVTHFITVSAKVAIPVAGAQSPAVFKDQGGIVYADPGYFKVFEYKWLAGLPQNALSDPFQVVLTESRAKTYFASLPPNLVIGQQLIYDDSVTATVSGVVKDPEGVTDLVFDEFISRATIERIGLKERWGWDEWGSINSSSQMFVKLVKGGSPSRIEASLAGLREKHRQRDQEDRDDDKDNTQHFLQPLADIHFNADYDSPGGRQAHKPTLLGLLAVALFLLLLGCINFINLTTAQSSQRAKEIGIRKTMGSGKSQIVFQFLTETFILTLTATVVSIALVPWLLKIFGDFIPPGVSFASLNHVHVWVFLLLLVVVMSLLAGFYPAWVLTRFKPVTALKNQAHAGTAQTRKAWLRKSLTVTQFVIAQFLIVATLVVSKQIHYSLHKDLGYKKDAIVTANVPRNFFSNAPDNRRFALYEKLKTIPEIEKLSLSGSAPASFGTSTQTMTYNDGQHKVETMVETKSADTAYFDLYQMKLLAGRNLQQSDTIKEYVINETYARLLGFTNPSDAVGKQIGKRPIVGVIADFHTKSTRQVVKPLAFSSAAFQSYVLHLALKPRVAGSDVWGNALAKAEKAFKELYPGEEFRCQFYDESIASFYREEQHISRLLKWASGLCVFISCLGLLGLVIYITNTRTKEIGVRKVLGASVIQIVALLSKGFLSLVLIAFIITLPLAWWAMHNWLQDFAYRTSMSWWLFGLTGGGMLLVAILILSIRTIRAAAANPVQSLRTE